MNRGNSTLERGDDDLLVGERREGVLLLLLFVFRFNRVVVSIATIVLRVFDTNAQQKERERG